MFWEGKHGQIIPGHSAFPVNSADIFRLTFLGGLEMSLRYFFSAFIAVAVLAGCVGNPLKSSSSYSFDKYGKADPRWEVHQPGTILFVRPNGDVSVLASNSWLATLGLSVGNDLEADIKAACDDKGMCSVAERVEEHSGFEAKIKGEIASASAEISGVQAVNVTTVFGFKSIIRLSDKTDANIAFNRFAKTDGYEGFVAKLKAGLPRESGVVVVVSVIEVAPMGLFEVKFDRNISAEVQAKVRDRLKISPDLKYTFNKDSIRVEAMPGRPLLAKWRIDRIEF